MPELLDIAPTRGNLLSLKKRLRRIREIHDLLDRKREVLMRELLDMIADAESIDDEARTRFQEAYRQTQRARMTMGIDRLRWISLATSSETEVTVRERRIMGVSVPLLTTTVEQEEIPYGPGDTSTTLDEARKSWLEALSLIGRLAETTLTIWRLAMELRSTQRRVNALEEFVVPRYKATVDHIDNILMDQERENIVHAKKVKALREESGEAT